MNAASAPATSSAFTHGKIVKVDLPASHSSSSYDIIIGENILSETGTLISLRLGKRQCLIITDENVAKLHLPRLEAVLGSTGHTLLPSIVIPPGEASKNFASLQSVLERMTQNVLNRKTLIIAFGGGVIGDLAGFAASIALRGLDFVQIPTTLLAQVDSSVGGKNGIHSAQGKNTVGTFYQPKLVIIDVAFLDSLPRREVLAGYAEVVKYGLINDEPFFRWCQANGDRLLKGDREAQIYAIAESCKNKASVVAADEREAGIRALLNLGHTFAHALETVTGYSDRLLHGEAVAIGVVMAFRLSAELGLCPREIAHEIRDYYAAAGLPVSPKPFVQNIDSLIQLMKQDKKAESGKLTLILAHGIGKSFVARDVKEHAVRDLWKAYMQE